MATSVREKRKQERRRASAKEWANKPDRQFEPTCIALKEGFEFVKWERPGTYKYDVMPYVVGEGNPDADQGFDFFERTYSCHRGLGAEGKSSYFCPAQNRADGAEEPCYPCVKIAREGNSMDQDLVASLRAKRRIMLNVKDVTDGKWEGKKTQVLDQPYGSAKRPFFGTMLKDVAQIEEYQDFWMPDSGLTMIVKVAEDSMGTGSKFMKATSIAFVPRKYNYADDVAEESCPLDDCIIVPDYDDMKNLLEMGGVKEEEPEKEEPTRGRQKEEEPEEPEEEGELEEGEEGTSERTAEELGLKVKQIVTYQQGKNELECEILKISGDGTSLTLEGPKGEIIKAVSPEDVEIVPVADEEEEKPKAKANKVCKDKEEPEDDLPDPDAEEEEEEEETEDPFGDEETEEEPEEDDPPPKRTGGKRR